MSRSRVFTFVAVAALSVVWTAPAWAQAKTVSKEKEKQLIAVLASDAPGAEKALACKGLAIDGSAEAVPELAKLLADERLSSWARIALESIPGPEADAALVAATETIKGRQLIGVVNSLGVRRPATAVEALVKQLKNEDAAVAECAAVALGRIGDDASVKALKPGLAGDKALVSAVAEGLVLAAERMLAGGKSKEAAALYDEVRAATVPAPRKQEATRGAIMARGSEGIPLMLEQLRGNDRGLLNIGLSCARELAGDDVTDALATEAAKAPADRATLILYALADRQLRIVPPALREIVTKGPTDVRIAAIHLLGQKGGADDVGALLPVANDKEAEVAAAAKAALKELAGEKVDAAIQSRLAGADPKTLAVLLELVGQRRIGAIDAAVKGIDHADAGVRSAALTALGEVASPKEISVLLARVNKPRDADDAAVAQKALRAACVRMPDREKVAAEVAAAMAKANVATKGNLLETLAAMGGAKALETIGAAVKGADAELQDVGSKLLGEWMTVDAGPTLLDIAKTSKSDKYQVRAMRGYLRIARQFVMPDKDRAEMAQSALDTATRVEEQKLALTVLERYPSMETLPVAIAALKIAAIKDDAPRVAMFVAQKVADKDEARKMMIKAGIAPIKLEIVKAEYGAEGMYRDVTAIVQKQAGEFPLILLPAADYNKSFGGDPAPGKPKNLKVAYKIDGAEKSAMFDENAAILLPTR